MTAQDCVQVAVAIDCWDVRRVIVGDGDSCDVLRNCDRNARCVFDDHVQSYVCQCNEGFAGSVVSLLHNLFVFIFTSTHDPSAAVGETKFL